MFLFSMTVTNSRHVWRAAKLAVDEPTREDVGPWITTFGLPGEINFFKPGSQWDRYPPQGGKMLMTFYCFFYKWTERTMYTK